MTLRKVDRHYIGSSSQNRGINTYKRRNNIHYLLLSYLTDVSNFGRSKLSVYVRHPIQRSRLKLLKKKMSMW